MDPRESLLSDARLGIELKEARSQKVWKWLLAQAKEAALKANSELVECDPQDYKKISILQGEVKRFYEMESWMESAVQLGLQAEDTFNTIYGDNPGR